MNPLDLIMREHTLILDLLDTLEKKIPTIKKQEEPPFFLHDVLDFFITYGDKTHHGKEEDIIFRKIGQKNLNDKLKKILATLLQEHVEAREKINNLKTLYNRHQESDAKNYKEIILLLENFISFYRKHIDRENDHFFKEALPYLSEQELEIICKECAEFDRSLIHEKYKEVVNSMSE